MADRVVPVDPFEVCWGSPGPATSTLAVADAGMVAKALAAAVGAPIGWSMVLFRTLRAVVCYWCTWVVGYVRRVV